MCEERVRKVTHLIERKVHRAARCRDSAECVRVDTSTKCFGTCGAWVGGRYAYRLRRAIRAIDETVCGTFQTDGCAFASPACRFEQGACVNRRCVGQPRELEWEPPGTGLVPFDAIEYGSEP